MCVYFEVTKIEAFYSAAAGISTLQHIVGANVHR